MIKLIVFIIFNLAISTLPSISDIDIRLFVFSMLVLFVSLFAFGWLCDADYAIDDYKKFAKKDQYDYKLRIEWLERDLKRLEKEIERIRK